MTLPTDPLAFFSDYVRLTGLPHLDQERNGEPGLIGKRLGLVNGSSWVTAWSNFFGRLYLPGVQLVNAGNDAIQLNFMKAHSDGKPSPPQSNIDRFVQYAKDLVELGKVDAILITCSTMNRSYPEVERAIEGYRIPVIQIDMPMMEKAVNLGGKVLVIATHGPTVLSTHALLAETADKMGKNISCEGITLEKAWDYLKEGNTQEHNNVIADAIRSLHTQNFSCVVLAQLSMSIFQISFPDSLSEFGLPVLTSGQYGFEYVRQILLNINKS